MNTDSYNSKIDIFKEFPDLCPENVRNTPISLFGVETPVGWDTIVRELLNNFNTLPKNKKPIVIQIKEKFAELRVYIQNESDEAFAFIEEAVINSTHTCMKCGNLTKSKSNLGYWTVVLCDDCKGNIIKNE